MKWGLLACCKDVGFYTQGNREPLQQQRDMTYVLRRSPWSLCERLEWKAARMETRRPPSSGGISRSHEKCLYIWETTD